MYSLVDAPYIWYKDLPGLEDVKGKSIIGGTLYQSRMFQATPQLVQGVPAYLLGHSVCEGSFQKTKLWWYIKWFTNLI